MDPNNPTLNKLPEPEPNEPAPETKAVRTDRQGLLVGIGLGLVAGIVLTFYFQGYIPSVSNLLINFLLALFIAITFIIFVMTWFRRKLQTWLFPPIPAQSESKEKQPIIFDIVSTQLEKLFQDTPETLQKAKTAAPELVKTFIWGYTRTWLFRLIVAVFAAIGGLLGTILLLNQNQLLENQNKKIDVQIQLAEAERRSALIFLMGNIMDKVNEEIKEQLKALPKDQRDTFKYELNDVTIGQLVGLSNAFQPYKYLDGDTLIDQPLSPERGQLLLTLAQLRLSDSTHVKLFSKANFSLSDLSWVNLSKADLSRADLSRANLSGAYLVEADLRRANLIEANLSKADLIEADLSGANLSGANLSEANLSKAHLSEANLSGAVLWKADLSGANLSGAVLRVTFFKGANLSEADLRGAKQITSEQFLSTFSLFETTGIPDSILAIIKTHKPQLLENPFK